jgi:hypothetical protein
MTYKGFIITETLGGYVFCSVDDGRHINKEYNTLLGVKRAISKHITEQSQVRAEMYDFGHDMCGNPTSHFTIWHQGKVLYRTKRRQQCGYGSDRADGALVSARAYVGNHLNLKSYAGRRSDREITAIFQ